MDYTFEIAENSSNGTIVGTVADFDDAYASLSSWAIAAGNDEGIFAVDASSSQLTIVDNTGLNYEEVIQYTLVFKTQTSTNDVEHIEVTVNVSDVNEFVPVITAGQVFSIDELTMDGSTVGTVLVTDGDGSSTCGEWLLFGSDMNSIFSINSTTGEITVVNAELLDFESTSTYTLLLCVNDGHNVADVESVVINLNDINEAPSIIENNTLNSIVSTTEFITTVHLSASDPDNSASELYYTVTAVPTSGYLQNDGILVNVNATFTQDDIANNRLTYTANRTSTGNDNFTFVLSDRDGLELTEQAFYITVAIIPTITSATAQSMTVNSSLELTLAMTDAEVGSDGSMSLIVEGGENYSVSGTTVTPTKDYSGILMVPLKVTDNKYTSDAVYMEIIVAPEVSVPLISSSEVTVFTCNSAVLGGNVSSDDDITDRGVVYSSTDKSPSIGVTDVVKLAIGSGVGNYYQNITGLKSEQIYYVKAYATNAAGTSYGDVVSFTTLIDTDGDGIADDIDTDDDNDGTPDVDDAFPLDPNEDTDTDGDRIGDNEDQDDDNDGILDADDTYPRDAMPIDTDGDGLTDTEEDINNNGSLSDDDTDNDGIPNYLDTDDDNDGIPTKDELTIDNDCDGVPDYNDVVYGGELYIKWNKLILIDNSNNEYYSFQWYRNGELIPGATDQSYYEEDGLDGTYHVVVNYSTDDSEYKSICPMTVTKTVVEDVSSMSLYPNPIANSDVLNLTLSVEGSSSDEQSTLSIYNTSGRLVFKQIVGNGENTLNLSDLVSGIYTVRVQTADGSTLVEKIVVR